MLPSFATVADTSRSLTTGNFKLVTPAAVLAFSVRRMAHRGHWVCSGNVTLGETRPAMSETASGVALRTFGDTALDPALGLHNRKEARSTNGVRTKCQGMNEEEASLSG